MIHLKYHCLPLMLGNFETFKEKFNAVIISSAIETVFCRLPDEQLANLSIDEPYNLNEILVPGGKPSGIKSIFQEYLKYLEISLDEYLNSEADGYYSINEMLVETRNLCIALLKKNDISRSLSYHENEIKFLTIDSSGNWLRLYIGQIIMDKTVEDELLDHFSIRQEFYHELIEIIDKKIVSHLYIPSFPQKPYRWKSENPHLEIAELLYALLQKRIEIKEGEKGSYAKFVKEFYNLFGLDDGPYHQKLQIIRKRDQKISWLQELPDYINSLPKKTAISKNES